MTAIPAVLSARVPAAPAAPLRVSDLFSDFVDYLDASPKTMETYRYALRQFGTWLQTNGIAAPTAKDVRAYRDHVAALHTPGTVRCYLVAVRLFFRWASLRGYYDNVADNVRAGRTDSAPKKDALTSRQAHSVLEAAAEDTTEAGLRNYAILALLLSCGLRAIEAVRASVSDLRPRGDETVLYVQGKGHASADTFVRVPAPVEDALRRYLASRGSLNASAPLFASTARRNPGGRLTTRSVSGIVKGAFLRVGLNSPFWTCHSTRHTAITLALLSGQSLQEASLFARHADISTTQIYAHNLERERNGCAHAVANLIF